MFSLLDAVQVVLGIAAYGALVALPGLTLARVAGFGQSQNGIGAVPGLLVGLAVLPLIDSLAVRAMGIDATLAIVLAMAGVGLWLAARSPVRRRPSRIIASLAAVWLAIVVGEWIDIDVGDKLFQSFTVLDMVKHAATTQAIVDSGAAPRDPFFLRPERVGYYYFFYTPVALAQRLLGGLIDARAAVGGAIFWTGIGLYQLVPLTVSQAGLIVRAPRGLPFLAIAVLLAGGLDILPVLGLGFGQGLWMPDPVKWNTQVTGWLESLFWVPHHLTALFAAMLGLIVLSQAIDGGTPREKTRTTVFAAACFASTLGLSVWVTLALVVTGAVWCATIAWARRWRALAIIVAAGALAMVFAGPQILDLIAGRAPSDAPPIALTVREFTLVDVVIPEGAWNLFARFMTLPLNYFLSFGVLVLGSIAFWRGQRAEPGARPEFARVLAIAAASGLLLGAFLKSTMFNNDLGWRVALFPLLAGTVWTIAALDRYLVAAPTALALWHRLPKPMLACLAIGWATSLYALAGLRAYPLYNIDQNHRFLLAHPETERGLRVAYAWADRNLPPDEVLQHDPTKRRAFAFALYGRHPTGVSDLFASIFGAAPHAVEARIAALGPIFHGDLQDPAIRATAKANGVDALVVTKDDPVWSKPDSFVWRAKADYASAQVRIIPVSALSETSQIAASVAR